MTKALRRPGRTPGTVNLGVSLLVLAVLLPLLLHAATSAPPTAAEFSPNAKQVIKKAPPGQAAEANGTGEGAAPGAGSSPTPSPTAAAPSATPSPTGPPDQKLAENLLKRCVGPPPLRQIEDPQSPPCIAYWKGDNGGVTFRGVTRESIYIAVPTPESAVAQYNALFKFFNDRFQFYGRKLVPEYCGDSNSGASDEATQNSEAAKAAAGCNGQPKPFASTFYRQNNGAFYMKEMGCRYRVLTMGSYSPYDSKYLDRCAGYLFQYPMEVDEEFANIGEWICARLKGGRAEYAGGNDNETPSHPLSGHPRKFGVVLEPFTEGDAVARPEALRPMLSRLHACGIDVPAKDVLISPLTNNFNAAEGQNAVLGLRRDGVTSVICMCNFFAFGTLARAAESSAFQPEWITSTFGLNDVNSSFILGAAPASQLQHMFGVTFQPRMVNPLQNPYNVALHEGDPAQTPDTATTGEAKLEVYRALLLIASGVQMAGPNLTPATFRDGLRKTVFPNPLTSTRAGFVDVRPDGYSLTKDAAEWWYSTQDPGPFSDSAAHPGTVCYIDGGRRRELGSWPKGRRPFFVPGTCDSGA